MAFALQKRCSTTELSRHGLHRTGCQAIQGGALIADQPKHQLESIATSAFPELSLIHISEPTRPY